MTLTEQIKQVAAEAWRAHCPGKTPAKVAREYGFSRTSAYHLVKGDYQSLSLERILDACEREEIHCTFMAGALA